MPSLGPSNLAPKEAEASVGAALRDGAIKSLDDKVSDYLPEMKGSAYDDVSIRQLLTMTSGVVCQPSAAHSMGGGASFASP